jgi:hypothetical protein
LTKAFRIAGIAIVAMLVISACIVWQNGAPNKTEAEQKMNPQKDKNNVVTGDNDSNPSLNLEETFPKIDELTKSNPIIKKPEQSIIQIDVESISSLCLPSILAPAFIYDAKVPLMVSTNSDSLDGFSKIDSSALGDNLAKASESIARSYWESAPICILIDENYTRLLTITPLASVLGAPILIRSDKSAETFDILNCSFVINWCDGFKSEVPEAKIRSIEDVWKLQIAIQSAKKIPCEYVVLTNSFDSKAFSHNIDFDVRGLSSISGILAGKHNGLVVAGNYTVDPSWVRVDWHGHENKNYEGLVAAQNRIKLNLEKAHSIIQESGQMPKYLAVVGDAIAVPYCYYFINNADLTGGNYASLSGYCDLDGNESALEIAAGRIVAWNILDASKLIWGISAQSNTKIPINATCVCGEAAFGFEYTMPLNGAKMFLENGYTSFVVSSSIGSDNFKQFFESSEFIEYCGHGSPTNWGASDTDLGITATGLTSKYVSEWNLPNSAVFAVACATAAFHLTDGGKKVFSDSIALAFIHAGAKCYIGATQESVAPDFKSPEGSALVQLEFFRNVIARQSTGEAFRNALNVANDNYTYTHFVLIGDPAFTIET